MAPSSPAGSRRQTQNTEQRPADLGKRRWRPEPRASLCWRPFFLGERSQALHTTNAAGPAEVATPGAVCGVTPGSDDSTLVSAFT